MTPMKNLALLLLFCSLSYVGFSQNIQFTNPSFEDFPRAGRSPINWYDCGFPNETPPDVLPDPTFDVTKEAYHGETYLGMVTRDNDTWEAVSQAISEPMEIDTCYQFEIYLTRSLTYMSKSRVSNKTLNYSTPVRLKVWGGFGNCDKAYLLAETKPVINTAWNPYVIQFEAKEAYTHLTFEASYTEGAIYPYSGNLLLDNLSEIKRVDCSQKN